MQIRISIGKTGWGISSLCPSIDRLCSYCSCNAYTVSVPTTPAFTVAIENRNNDYHRRYPQNTITNQCTLSKPFNNALLITNSFDPLLKVGSNLYCLNSAKSVKTVGFRFFCKSRTQFCYRIITLFRPKTSFFTQKSLFGNDTKHMITP